jgi:hypothetical protein
LSSHHARWSEPIEEDIMESSEIVACTLDNVAMKERRKRWHDLAARAFVERAVTDQGLRLVFRDGAGVEDELRELARLERQCCAFADWTVGAADGYVLLEVGGSGNEAVAAVQSMFEGLAG